MKTFFHIVVLCLFVLPIHMEAQRQNLEQNILSLTTKFAEIPSARRAEIRDLASEIQRMHKQQGEVDVNFICSSNARRSQLAELWFNVATDYYGLDDIIPYSGGLNTTAFNNHMIQALRRFGFSIEEKESSSRQPNPHYVFEPKVKYGKKREMYSKKFDEQTDMLEDFVAVLVCSDTDRDYPIVQGASVRFSLPFDNPKSADGTAQEVQVYDQKVEEIGIQMMYLAQQVHVARHQG